MEAKSWDDLYPVNKTRTTGSGKWRGELEAIQRQVRPDRACTGPKCSATYPKAPNSGWNWRDRCEILENAARRRDLLVKVIENDSESVGGRRRGVRVLRGRARGCRGRCLMAETDGTATRLGSPCSPKSAGAGDPPNAGRTMPRAASEQTLGPPGAAAAQVEAVSVSRGALSRRAPANRVARFLRRGRALLHADPAQHQVRRLGPRVL